MNFPIAEELFPTSKDVVSNASLNALVSKVNLISADSICQNLCRGKSNAAETEFCFCKCFNEINCIRPSNFNQKISKQLNVKKDSIYANIQLDVTNQNFPVFILNILDKSIIEDFSIDNLVDYSSTKEGFVIRGQSSDIELKLILTNPVLDNEWFRLNLIIRKIKITNKCNKCVKDLVNIVLVGVKNN